MKKYQSFFKIRVFAGLQYRTAAAAGLMAFRVRISYITIPPDQAFSSSNFFMNPIRALTPSTGMAL